MNISRVEQQSAEWWQLKVGKIGGTRFGKVLSNRENSLIYELMNETLSGHPVYDDDYLSDDMQYGLDNEKVAIKLYEQQTGIKTELIGAIISDFSPIHLHSADAIANGGKIVVEVKCTQNGHIHLKRIFEGVDNQYEPQCINAFAVCDEVEEVHFVSYCGYRPERPLHIVKLFRNDFSKQISIGRERIEGIEEQLKEKIEQYRF